MSGNKSSKEKSCISSNRCNNSNSGITVPLKGKKSLASRKTRLETRFSILESLESSSVTRELALSSFEPGREKLSFREVNCIREALSCDVEGKASRLSSSCLTKNAFNLSFLPERSTNDLSRYCNLQNDWSSPLIRTSLAWQDLKPEDFFTPMVSGIINCWFLKLFCKVVL